MSEITNKDIKKIAKLARIEISEDDCQKLTTQLSNTIHWIEKLDEVNTDNVDPLINVNNSILRMMPDIVNDGNISQDVLKNAKSSKYGYFAVPKVIE